MSMMCCLASSSVITSVHIRWCFCGVFETGIEVVNARDLVKEPPKFPHWEPPVKDDPHFSPPKTVKDDPDYHEDPVYEFHPECCLIEGTPVDLYTQLIKCA